MGQEIASSQSEPSEIDVTAIPVLNDNVEWRSYLKGVVINPDFALNEAAASMFKLIDGKRSIEMIGEEITKEYEVDLDVALQDCWELVQDLRNNGILKLRSVATHD
ncbi:PqqD family protein [Martelella mangrovi]|uniref:PqqD family protein n=1 Tax=Martelella mangrovi TaxID=1397477 RepID=A0ABV2ICS2_9HYPH